MCLGLGLVEVEGVVGRNRLDPVLNAEALKYLIDRVLLWKAVSVDFGIKIRPKFLLPP